MRKKKIKEWWTLIVLMGAVLFPMTATAQDGTQKWAFKTGAEVNSSPAIGSDGTIYVGSSDYNLYAVNPDGTQKWAFKTGKYVYSSPAIGSDGIIYVGSHDGNLYAVNPDGTQKWAFKTGTGIASSPAIGADGTVYVGSRYVGTYDGSLYAVNPDGTQKWTFKTGDYINSSPAIGKDGTVYVGSNDRNLYAINTSSGGLANSAWPMFHHDLKHTGTVNQMPIAQLPASKKVVFDNITLDASQCSDPDGSIVSYQWQLACQGNSAYDRTAEGVTPLLTGLQNGFYDVTLTVTDDKGATDVTTMLLGAAGACEGDIADKPELVKVIHFLQVLAGQ